MPDAEFIVAEVSKNWNRVETTAPGVFQPSDFVRAKFEEIINVNWRRGYLLHSWHLHRLMTSPEVLNETIVAVFRRRQNVVADGPALIPPDRPKPTEGDANGRSEDLRADAGDRGDPGAR